MTDGTNSERAERAYRTLLVYGQRVGNEDVEENATDFLTDLAHLLDEYGTDLDTILDRARMHYAAELQEAAR
jgi:hypothetical protein